MAEIGLYQTSSSLPKIIKQTASKRKGTKGSLSFFFWGYKFMNDSWLLVWVLLMNGIYIVGEMFQEMLRRYNSDVFSKSKQGIVSPIIVV